MSNYNETVSQFKARKEEGFQILKTIPVSETKHIYVSTGNCGLSIIKGDEPNKYFNMNNRFAFVKMNEDVDTIYYATCSIENKRSYGRLN